MRIRRTQTIFFVLFFLGFFAFSNYVLGFLGGIFSAEAPVKRSNGVGEKGYVDVEGELSKLEALRQKIEDQNRINERLRGGVDAARKSIEDIEMDGGAPVQRKKQGKEDGIGKRPVADPPPARRPAKDVEIPDDDNAKCKHTRRRDYEQDPIRIEGSFQGRFTPCDIPCEGGGEPDASLGGRRGSCGHIKSIFFTMENVQPAGNAYDIVANTRLDSDVPLPYFNWVEYNFKRPAVKKTASAQVAAFISNCGPQKRLDWMKAMMNAGVKIDSYGACMRNKEMPADILQQYGADYNGAKMHVVSTYKFTMAFENSETDDYVTEKLFGVLVAGSVPLYHGAPNGKKFGPSEKSMLFADDFGTPEKMAEFILRLDKDDAAYEEYLEWKKTGPSDDFTALMDIGNVHSSCRLCIRTADLHRKEVGEVVPHKLQGEDKPKGDSTRIKVRERGKFWLTDIYLVDTTLKELKTKIERYIPHEEDAYIYAIYEYWSRKDIASDSDVAALGQDSELEVVYVVHQDWSK